jgi:hypothetical protein
VLFRGDFTHELRAKVLELVGKFDLLGDSHTILTDARRSIGFFDDDIAAPWAQRDFYRIVENLDAAQECDRVRRSKNGRL